MACIEGRQHVGDVIGTDRTDTQMAGLEAARLVEIVGRFLLVGEEPARDVQKAATGLGEFDASAAAHEQLDAEFLLQRFHLRGDGRLADAQLARGGGEAQPLRHGMEGPELRVPHIDFLNASSRMFELDKCERRPEDCQKADKAKAVKPRE